MAAEDCSKQEGQPSAQATTAEPAQEEGGAGGGGLSEGAAGGEEGHDGLPTKADLTGKRPLSPHYDHNQDIVVRLEFLGSNEVKTVILLSWLSICVGLAFLCVAIYFKVAKPHNYLLEYDVALKFNAVLASVCVGALLTYWVTFMRRLLRSNRSGKRWVYRRKRLVTAAGVELTLQLVNAIFFLVPNVYALAGECAWFDNLVTWSGLIRWTCWNTLFLIYWGEAHCSTPASGRWLRAAERNAMVPPGSHTIVMDAPLWMHWRKAIVWAVMEGLLIALAVLTRQDIDAGSEVATPDQPFTSCRQLGFVCYGTTAFIVLLCLQVACVVAYFGFYMLAMKRAFDNLLSLPYNQFRTPNLIIRAKVRLRAISMAFFVLCLVCYTFIELRTCNSFILSWLGYLPMQVVACCTVLANAYMMTPKRPQEAGILQVWLQEFAWTEEDVERKRAERASTLGPADTEAKQALDREPMFCFETAMKALYWSFLVYDYQEKQPSRFSLEDALAVYDLQHFELFWEKTLDTKAMAGWNDDMVIIAFRGTASMVNVKSDMQVWRRRWPEGVGRPLFCTAPMVHLGFHRSYTSDGMNQRLLEWLEQLVHPERSGGATRTKPLKVLVTGHSLGGAMATMCAFEIGNRFSEDLVTLSCYTFGAPRTGNHAFARLYNRAVPETWHLINNLDVVTSAGKFWVLYKRPGHRVLINKLGDLVVRPSSAETVARRLPGAASVGDHLLVNYRMALTAILGAQFSSKGEEDGREGVLKLAAQTGASVVLKSAGLAHDTLDVLQQQGWEAFLKMHRMQKSARKRLPWRRKSGVKQQAAGEGKGEGEEEQDEDMGGGSSSGGGKGQLDEVVVTEAATDGAPPGAGQQAAEAATQQQPAPAGLSRLLTRTATMLQGGGGGPTEEGSGMNTRGSEEYQDVDDEFGELPLEEEVQQRQ